MEVVSEVAGDGADGQEVFGGVGHEGFSVGAGGEFEEAVLTFGMWFDGWFEMVVEGAFGGFVEFLGIGGFVGRGVVGFWRMGCWLVHDEYSVGESGAAFDCRDAI